MINFRSRTILLGLFSCWTAAAGEPLKVLAIGDSLTEEYRFELPFSAPKSLIPPVANTTSWVEILATRRADHFSMGSYEAEYFEYNDLRNAGYKFNYGIPGFTALNWSALINQNYSSNILLALGEARTRSKLTDHLGDVDAVIIFLGGNDLKSDYSGIFRDDDPPPVMAQLLENLAEIHDFIRSREPGLPILIATAPDIGSTYVIATHPNYQDPFWKIRARQRIMTINEEIIALAASRGATVIRIDHLTDMIRDRAPFQINGTEFSFTPDDGNAPLHIFCHDGFHPASMAQGIIANLIIDGLNQATNAVIPPLANREILASVVGVNPDQPYLDWAGDAGGMIDNPDGDGLTNLAEFLLGTSPTKADSPWSFTRDGGLRFLPLEEPLRFAGLEVLQSTTLDNDWTAVPENRIEIFSNGTWIIHPDGARCYYRIAAKPRP